MYWSYANGRVANMVRKRGYSVLRVTGYRLILVFVSAHFSDLFLKNCPLYVVQSMLQTLRLNERFCVICHIEYYEYGIFVYGLIVALCVCL